MEKEEKEKSFARLWAEIEDEIKRSPRFKEEEEFHQYFLEIVRAFSRKSFERGLRTSTCIKEVLCTKE